MTDNDWKLKNKVRELMSGLHTAMLWAWYLIGGIAAVCLWFFPIPETKIQAFFFGGWLALYSAFSAGIAKTKEIAGSLD